MGDHGVMARSRHRGPIGAGLPRWRWAALAVAVAVATTAGTGAAAFKAQADPLPKQVRDMLVEGFWHPGCPVALSQLRVLTVTRWGFDRREHTGQLVVNREATAGLGRAFARLHALRFPIRHMELVDAYGPVASRPRRDVTASFACRQAVPSPCTGGKGTGTWSNHAYGLAVDINPHENPYVGCGRSRDPSVRPYFDRSRLRRGMVTPAVVEAFRATGWEWGGAWTGSTKDYMHFSHNGH
jgi:hypothetical protein